MAKNRPRGLVYKKSKTIEERFWEKVDVRGPDDCWLWTGCVSKDTGYGQFRPVSTGPIVKPHRFAMQLAGRDPGHLYGLHKCDNRRCCNERHLFAGTQQDNMDDMIAKGRERHAVGEAHAQAKLSDAQVAEIRARSPKNESERREVANVYGITTRHVLDLVLNKKRIGDREHGFQL